MDPWPMRPMGPCGPMCPMCPIGPVIPMRPMSSMGPAGGGGPIPVWGSCRFAGIHCQESDSSFEQSLNVVSSVKAQDVVCFPEVITQHSFAIGFICNWFLCSRWAHSPAHSPRALTFSAPHSPK